MRRLIEAILLLFRCEQAKELGILVPRHQIAVLRAKSDSPILRLGPAVVLVQRDHPHGPGVDVRSGRCRVGTRRMQTGQTA